MSIRKKSYSRYGAVSSFNLGGVNMVSKNTLKPGKFLLYFFGMIVIVLILGFQPTESAQTQATYPPLSRCRDQPLVLLLIVLELNRQEITAPQTMS